MQQNRDFLILYGTQTNTAQYAAEEMGRECVKRGYNAEIMQMDNYEILGLPMQKLVIFIVATTGEGEAPTTMQNSWKFLLRPDLPPGSLQSLSFSVFGLGDSSYELFNAMAKKLTQRLIDLGANLIHKVGLGDYQHDFEYQAEFDPWLESLWPKLEGFLGKGIQKKDEQFGLLAPVYKVDIDKSEESGKCYGYETLEQLPMPNGGLNQKVFISRVLTNEKLTAEGHFQDTRKIVLDLQNFAEKTGYGSTTQQLFEPGDVIMVQPKNKEEEVLRLLQRYSLGKGDIVKVSIKQTQLSQVSKESLIHFPENGVSAYELFSYWLDLSSPPSRHFMHVLSHFAQDEIHQEKLREFASKSPEGKSEYYRYAVREKRTVCEVLDDFFPSFTQENLSHTSPNSEIKLPLAYLLQLCGKQKPREFSISSAWSEHPGEAHLTMAVTEYKTPFKREKKGLCSHWLRIQHSTTQAAESDPIPVWLKKGTMTIHPDPKIPLILVGPGTGIAAFRSFIQHYGVKTGQEQKQKHVRQIVLIFGCRSKSQDYYYETEWKSYTNLTVLPAFSRDEPSHPEASQKSKEYVQHVIRRPENAQLLSTLILDQQATIYVSGRAKLMPKSVEKAFVEIIQQSLSSPLRSQAPTGAPDGQTYVQNMKAQRRYQQEVW